ncbi:MAG: SPOR domain-containing protein [Candidatus Symbiothrix sp.]|jgi:hypothetical protein|nr:SPOR domain-containing protein [Candidatus Symbiothrix sp.]
MKNRKHLLTMSWGLRVKPAMTALLILFSLNGMQAQTSIIEDLQSTSNSSEGVIHIESDADITALVGTPGNRVSASGNSDFVERTGYRIQVFMGSNPSTARSEASSKQAAIKESFPEIGAYLTYNAPNWKLVVGDFISREEATVFKQQLQREFPQYGREMYIITDKIKLPVVISE